MLPNFIGFEEVDSFYLKKIIKKLCWNIYCYVVLTDHDNSRVIIIDRIEDRQISHISLSSKPLDVTKIDNTIIAVSLPDDNIIQKIDIQIIDVKVTIQTNESECNVLSYFNEHLYAEINSEFTDVMDLHGNALYPLHAYNYVFDITKTET